MGSSFLDHQAYLISERENDFFFVTDFGAEYSVYFTDGDGYSPNASFADNIKMFGFSRIKRAYKIPRPGSDSRIMPTVMKVLYQILASFPEIVVIYVCSQEGGLQKKRSEIFEDWFLKWQDFGDISVQKIDYNLYNQLYCSCLFRSGHPCETEIRQVIEQTIIDKL